MDDSDSDSMDSDDDEEDGGKKNKRKNAAKKEERDVERRERALADGTVDENPETVADFERLLTTHPNSSEHWIRYMAYHLSLGDVEAARQVAERALERIAFRQEGERLNVWTALLALEFKYGSKDGLQETVDRACQHNNGKQVYLRVCEMMEKEAMTSLENDNNGNGKLNEVFERADDMFSRMCKKFKSKKTVWIAYVSYLLRTCSSSRTTFSQDAVVKWQQERQNQAHEVTKRAFLSLADYKHVETMSRFAQLELEHGNQERGRTLFEGLLEKYPKRLDLFFVYVDKLIKSIVVASSLEQKKHKKSTDLNPVRQVFRKTIQRKKLSDKQMKALFKKWYRMEEQHGTPKHEEEVKKAAKSYVEQTTNV